MMPDAARVIAIDVETTGLSASRGGRIIEIGAVAVDECATLTSFNRREVGLSNRA